MASCCWKPRCAARGVCLIDGEVSADPDAVVAAASQGRAELDHDLEGGGEGTMDARGDVTRKLPTGSTPKTRVVCVTK